MKVKPIPEGYHTITPYLAVPADQFYGDRAGAVRDLAGNQWWFATHKEEMSAEEMARRAAARRP